MFFNSTTFFVFLPLVFLVYQTARQKSNNTENLVLLMASYIFYAWWDWRFLSLILLSSFTDFVLGKEIFKATLSKKRKLLLLISVAVNLGILFFFKYFNFFIDSLQSFTGSNLSQNSWNSLHIILPVGISFYTFQTLSYTIDIYRKQIEPTKSALTFFTFVAFFPQLVAGPIERAKNLIPQFEKKAQFDSNQLISGFRLMLWGFFKKMVIADQLAVLVDAVYKNPENYGSGTLVLATVFFGFQIYCDFSGYSDIAIGTARLFGKELMINFRTPYFASSFRDFWHRWHISLSTWFRDYVFFPLGGSKTSSINTLRNVLITFVVSGLWHGANVTFLIWGFVHGIFYWIEKAIEPYLKLPKKIRTLSGWLLTFTGVNFAWLFFRAESGEHILQLLNKITSQSKLDFSGFSGLIFNDTGFSDPGRMLATVFPVFILTEFIIGKRTFSEMLHKTSRPVRWSIYYIIIAIVLFFGVLNSAPQFIYFQF